MDREHRYATTVEWTGNVGTGTSSHRAYSRDHTVAVEGKPTIAGSSDPSFRGDPKRYNPEDLMVASLSTCHMLWYLGLCATAGIVVTRYVDHAEGIMTEQSDGAGRFLRVVLRPQVNLAAGSDLEKAEALHDEAHIKCFIANSVNFPVDHEPTITIEGVGEEASGTAA